VNNLDYNLGIIQLIIPNKQGLRIKQFVVYPYCTFWSNTILIYFNGGHGEHGGALDMKYIYFTLPTEHVSQPHKLYIVRLHRLLKQKEGSKNCI
jgi:hypothetical protein